MTASPTTPRGRRLLEAFLNDVVVIWPDGRPAVSFDELATLLSMQRPGRYADCTVQTIGTLVRAAGIPTISVRTGIHVQRGMRWDDIADRGLMHESVVYFAERHGFLKIGVTSTIERRIAALNRGSSAIPGMTIDPVNLLAVMPGDQFVEAALHQLFRAQRYDGEWFLYDEPLVGFVSALAAVKYAIDQS